MYQDVIREMNERRYQVTVNHNNFRLQKKSEMDDWREEAKKIFKTRDQSEINRDWSKVRDIIADMLELKMKPTQIAHALKTNHDFDIQTSDLYTYLKREFPNACK